MGRLSILAIDDDEIQLEWLRIFFEGLPQPECRLFTVTNSIDFYNILQRETIDVVISDFYLPKTSGLEITERVKKWNPRIEIIIITVGTEINKAVETLKFGAFDFLQKPLDQEQLSHCIRRIDEKKQIETEESRLSRELKGPLNFSNIVYRSEAMEKTVYQAARCAESDINVLIRGESGTGKELIAYLIHYASARKNYPFTVVNMAALPDGLIESELFGHTKGAFTGAVSQRKGRFEEARGGSLFIDEIGDASSSIQAKILRAIQFKTFQKVGDNQTLHSDVRIIAATNRNLEALIENNQFREDLFFRLNVVSLQVPPLRDRKDDIEPLIEFFLDRFNQRHGKKCQGLTREALDLVYQHDFPGNIRELENMIEHAMLFMMGNHITSDDLPPQLRQERSSSRESSSHKPWKGESLFNEGRADYEALLSSFETSLLEEALIRHQGNQSAAARALGISERKLRSRMERLNLSNTFKNHD